MKNIAGVFLFFGGGGQIYESSHCEIEFYIPGYVLKLFVIWFSA